jgi:signal peptidase I
MDPDVEAPSDDAGEERPSGGLRNIVEWVAIIVGAFAVALVIKTFLIQAFYIPSESMFPTLTEDDRVLVNKLSYELHDVNRGDLVVFSRPPNEPESEVKDLIKRVVALEGETIEERDGQLYIDGELLEEPYLQDGVESHNLTKLEVPDDHVFVMGDNRTASRVSRYFGPIDTDLIVGRAFVKVWPLTDVGTL